MTGIESLTLAAGFLLLLCCLWPWQRRERIVVGMLLAGWLVAADTAHWLALGALLMPTVWWLRRCPDWQPTRLPAKVLRESVRWGLLVAWGAVTLQYLLYIWQLGRGDTPLLARPDIVDAFLPIAGGLGLRAWSQLGITDPHHPAAMVTVLVLSLSALLLGRSFCSWACPVGLVGEGLHRLRSRLIPGEWTPPRWLDGLLRAQKFLVLGFLLFVILLAVPSAALPGYLASAYHQAADMKMGAFFFTLSPVAALCLGWVVLLTASFRQGFCRYLCPYGAWLGMLGWLSPLRIRRDSGRCLRSEGHDCDKCSRACPSRIPVHQLIAVRTLACSDCRSCIDACPKRADALHLGTSRIRIPAARQLALLCLFLFVLPLLADGVLHLWVSQTPLEMRRHLLEILSTLSH